MGMRCMIMATVIMATVIMATVIMATVIMAAVLGAGALRRAKQVVAAITIARMGNSRNIRSLSRHRIKKFGWHGRHAEMPIA